MPICRSQFSVEANLRLQQTIFGIEKFEVKSPVIAHPGGIDVVVFARCLAIDYVLACADDGVAAGRATCANALGFFQEPDAHFETEVRRSERSDGTDVDGVQRIIILKPFAWIRSQDGMAAAVNKAEDVIVRYLLTKANASRAENTTLVIQRDSRADLHIFRFLNFVLEKTRRGTAVIDAE